MSSCIRLVRVHLLLVLERDMCRFTLMESPHVSPGETPEVHPGTLLIYRWRNRSREVAGIVHDQRLGRTVELSEVSPGSFILLFTKIRGLSWQFQPLILICSHPNEFLMTVTTDPTSQLLCPLFHLIERLITGGQPRAWISVQCVHLLFKCSCNIVWCRGLAREAMGAPCAQSTPTQDTSGGENLPAHSSHD